MVYDKIDMGANEMINRKSLKEEIQKKKKIFSSKIVGGISIKSDRNAGKAPHIKNK